MMMFKALTLALLALVSVVHATEEGLTGHIVTSPGNRLYDFPEIRSFLMDGDAESYEGVTVEFLYGRDAVLTIGRKTKVLDESTGRYLDMMIEEEQIDLFKYKTEEELHALLESKGFTKKSDKDVFELKLKRLEEQKDELHATLNKMLTSPLVHRKYPNPDELKEKMHEKELEIMIMEEKKKDMVRRFRG